MLLIREVMFCKPGKVRPLVEKFMAMNKLGQKMGMPDARADRFQRRRATGPSSRDGVPSLEAFEKMMSSRGTSRR
jgi:hypothetical protein